MALLPVESLAHSAAVTVTSGCVAGPGGMTTGTELATAPLSCRSLFYPSCRLTVAYHRPDRQILLIDDLIQWLRIGGNDMYDV